jgi:alkylation response protein AidB-like acyl-CoA dehydrogenase
VTFVAFENFLSDEQQSWRDTCNRFIDREITREYIRKCDMERTYYYEAYEKVAAQGWLGLMIPEDQGGIGGDAMDWVIFFEAMGKYSNDFSAATLGVSMYTAQALLHFGRADQVAQYIDAYLNAQVRFCIAISEPQAGSDAAAIRTRATKDVEDYLVTGLKQWCSGSSAKGAIIAMLVRTDPESTRRNGLTVLLVPNDLPNLELRKLDTLARRGTGTNQIFLDEVRVPSANRLGLEGQGWEIITSHLELERLSIAASMMGCAQQAVTDALQYAHTREQFGQTIFNFQVLKHMLADMQTKVDAARLLVYRAAGMHQAGQPCSREVSMAKLFASETLQEVTRNGVQIMGGHGMLPEADMERYFREGMQATVGGGSSQIMRTIIAQSMKKK